MSRHASLKQRLLILALLGVTVVWIGTAVITYQDARRELNEVLDGHLAQAAALLIAQTSYDLEEVETEHVPLLHKYARQVAFQIWEGGKFLRLHSANAPQQPLASAEQGFSDSRIEDTGWRVFSTWDNSGKFLIHVAERASVRDELARKVAKNLLYPLLIALPLLALLLWIAISRGLHPLVSLTREVAQREPDNLAPLDSGAAPAEVLPLIDRLNRLFQRIAASMENERRFTADAAHELRTPIAAIKAQAQVARGAQEDTARLHALNNVIVGCDRAAHLIEQLLTLAHLDAAPASVRELCALRAIAAEALVEVVPLSESKGVHLELSDGAELSVPGYPGLLRILLRNLIDNAVRYSLPGTVVQVSVLQERGQTCIRVSDNGSGIPEAERDKVLERFYRPLGTGERGSGLGLSIVKRIAEIHGASLQLAPPQAGRGLSVTLHFPQP